MCTWRDYTYFYLVNVKYFSNVVTKEELLIHFFDDMEKLRYVLKTSLTLLDYSYLKSPQLVELLETGIYYLFCYIIFNK